MIELIKSFLDFFLHLDDKLHDIILQFGNKTYAILFLIIFVETGLVIMPFLPGDSLLFVAGTFAASGSLNIFYLLALLFVAAVIGDTLNYYLGKNIGLKMLNLRIAGKQLVKPEYIDKTHLFFEKHGSKTIILARFVPIVRTFAPFVAGIGTMNYKQFISYNIIGGGIWVLSLTLAGYFFGQLSIVKENFETVIFGIIFISIIPIIVETIKHKFKKA